MMKKNILVAVLFVAFVLINTSACKRNNAAAPDDFGPVGHGITLSGSADPDTLTLPTPNSTWIEIKATKYNPAATEPYSPAVNEKVVLQPGIGRFEGYDLGANVSKTTDSSGIVRCKYIIGASVQNAIRINTTDYIEVILVDEQDPSDTSNYCLIPLSIVPFQEKDYTIVSGRVIDQFSNKGVADVVIELSTGGVAKTARGGTFSIYIYGGASLGWYGDITPTKEGAGFIPSKATFGSEDAPVYSDIYQTFYAVVKQAIQVSRPELNLDNSGSTSEAVYVFCSPDADFAATFIANTSASWIKVGTISTDANYGSITGTTARYIYIGIDGNSSLAARDGTVDITVTTPQNAVSSATITINQDL
jgi:hypothetical protein